MITIAIIIAIIIVVIIIITIIISPNEAIESDVERTPGTTLQFTWRLLACLHQGGWGQAGLGTLIFLESRIWSVCVPVYLQAFLLAS